MTTFTTSQIKTLALLTTGYSSEVKNIPSFSLRLAWQTDKTTGVFKPIGKSGYSIGVNQTDFGQQTDKVGRFVSGYQQWAGEDPARMVSIGINKLIDTLGANGLKLFKGDQVQLLSKSDVDKVNAFLGSPGTLVRRR